ncbi:MAG: tRNA (guanosine(37)-N1)-methyltransferase TrmD, partial [Candidatus Omnitrophica bacterium]|nr:tRNA (guanosine(37)-N1)-methyltransferase TrmD [Candidatus Omnitrophota bacterium]
MRRIDIITIFPKMFDSVFSESIIKRAQQKNKIKIFIHNLRDYSQDKHKKVDDRPYGGGPGMIMRPEPIFSAVESIDCCKKAKVILLSPSGEKLTQKLAEKLVKCKHLILICGRYEGVDER